MRLVVIQTIGAMSTMAYIAPAGGFLNTFGHLTVRTWVVAANDNVMSRSTLANRLGLANFILFDNRAIRAQQCPENPVPPGTARRCCLSTFAKSAASVTSHYRHKKGGAPYAR